MSLQRGIAEPSVEINNETIIMVPNSFSYMPGYGETNVRAGVSGAGQTSLVVTENAETKISEFKLSVYPTKEQIAKIAEWKTNPGSNGLPVLVTDENFSQTFNHCFITNNYEVPLGADTVIELEFKGAPVK